MRHRTLSKLIHRRLQKYKHIVDGTFLNVNGFLAVQSTIVATGTDNPVIASANNVQARARIRALWMELTFTNSSNAPGSVQTFDWYLIFNPQGNFVLAAGNNIGIQNYKNYVFKMGTITVPASASVAPAKVVGLVKIPSKYQRFMNGDIIQFAFSSRLNSGNTDIVNVKFIYKEVRG